MDEKGGSFEFHIGDRNEGMYAVLHDYHRSIYLNQRMAKHIFPNHSEGEGEGDGTTGSQGVFITATYLLIKLDNDGNHIRMQYSNRNDDDDDSNHNNDNGFLLDIIIVTNEKNGSRKLQKVDLENGFYNHFQYSIRIQNIITTENHQAADYVTIRIGPFYKIVITHEAHQKFIW